MNFIYDLALLRRIFELGENFRKKVELFLDVFIVLDVEGIIKFEFVYNVFVISHVFNIDQLEWRKRLS
jgi:hypothetical protein